MRPRKTCYLAYEQGLRDGAIMRQPCEVCGEEKSQGHHEDYSKPLEVKWLCPKHHRAEHVRLGWGYTNPPRPYKGMGAGQKESEETRRKKSLAQLALSPEIKRRRVEAAIAAKIANPISAETREKMRRAQLGKKHSPETLAKLSASHLGHIPWNKGLKQCQ